MLTSAYMHTTTLPNTILTLILTLSSPAFAGSLVEKAAAPPEQPDSFASSDTFSGYLFGKDNAWDSAYDTLQQWKKDYHLPISIGAHHWWHVDGNKRIYGNGYGVPGERGTYYYYLGFDPKLTLGDDGFFNEVGLHFQGRFRDDSDRLRSFYRETTWTYEAYAYAKTRVGTFKAGQIVQQFGIAWDNSWWEGVAYFDGYRFNPAYGVSWENTWKVSDAFSVDTSAQYFLTDDRVSGAIAGADAESALAGERNTFNARIVPTWQLNKDTKIALGGSFLTREIEDSDRFGVGLLDDRQTVWSTDLSVTWKNLTVFGQYTDSYGAISPARYVSGGPSDRQNSIEGGINYKLGPVSAHFNYSKGWDHNPDGRQYIYNPGLTFQLSKSLTLYTEYVKWNVFNSAGTQSRFDDGFEFILVWNF